MTRSEIKQALEWRYATKKFDSTKKISAADWEVLEDSLKLAPSSFGLQPYRFLVVENPEVREKLKAVSWNQTQVTEASHYVVLLYKEQLDEKHVEQYINRMTEVRSLPPGTLNGYKDMMVGNVVKGMTDEARVNWTKRQVYIAMGFILETAALLKIDACPMEGLDPVAYDEILGLNGSGWKSLATVALGYRHAEDEYQKNKKVRFADDHLVTVIK